MSDISTWSTNANNNNAVSPGGFPENMQKADVNNSARELMAAMRRWYDAPEWLDLMRSANGNALVVARQSDTQIKITGADMRGYFPTDRRLKLTGGSTQYGLVTNTAMSGSDTLVTLTLDSGVVDAATNHVDLYFAGTLREQVLKSVAPLLQGKHTVWIPAGAMRPTSAKGAGVFTSVATGADKPDIQAVPFNDALAAAGQITHTGNTTNGDTLTVNGKLMTFTTAGSGADEILVSTTGATQQAINTRDKLEAHADAGIDAATYTSNAGVVTITHKTPGAAGNAFTLVEVANNTTVSGATLTGGADETWVQFSIGMPKSWNEGTLTAIAFGLHQGSTASVLLELQGVAIGSTEPLSASYGTAVPLTFTTINANNVHKSPESAALTLAGPAVEGDLAIFRLGRKPFDDNLAAPFLLIGLMLLLVYSAATDA